VLVSSVMCAQKLWQVVRHWKGEPVVVDTAAARLGAWAATRFTQEEADFVIAINEVAYLTLVVPLRSAAEFRPAFRQMLDWALRDLRVPAEHVRRECATVGAMTLSWLRDPRMREALNHAQFSCAIELLYQHDPRGIQRSLNQLPHRTLRPDFFPAVAVASLFEVACRGPVHCAAIH
jgi:hypothetical protein